MKARENKVYFVPKDLFFYRAKTLTLTPKVEVLSLCCVVHIQQLQSRPRGVFPDPHTSNGQKL
jgi:hypothetical protein